MGSLKRTIERTTEPSVHLRPATIDDAPAVAHFLHQHMNRKITPDRWRHLLDYPWAAACAPHRGHLLAGADGSVHGFLGSVHAHRRLGGRLCRIVNLTGWYVEKPWRGGGWGLALMQAALSDGADAYTLLTNSARTLDLVQSLGFRLLDRQRHVWRRIDQEKKATDPVPEIPVPEIYGGGAARLRADAAGRRLIDDHAGLAVENVVIQSPGGKPTTALFSVTKKGADIVWWDLLACTAPAMLQHYAGDLAKAVLPDDRAVLSIDQRFLSGTVSSDACLPIPPTRLALVRQDNSGAPLEWGAIDHAYSEIPLLGLKLD